MHLKTNQRARADWEEKTQSQSRRMHLPYIGECNLNYTEAINRKMCKLHHRSTRTHIHTHSQHRHVVHFNCLTVWSNSKWICNLSIDSFSPRLWIKCFNYWCADVRCPLECCMQCRTLSLGMLLPSTWLSTPAALRRHHQHCHHPSPWQTPSCSL